MSEAGATIGMKMRLAQAVSWVIHPFVAAAILFAYIPMKAGLEGTVLYMGIGIFYLLTFVTPIVYLIIHQRKGLIDHFDIRDRVQRKRHYLAFLVVCLVQFVVMILSFDAPIMWALAFAYLFNTLIFGLINMSWKISIHGAGLGGLIGAMIYLEGWNFMPLGLLLFPLVWSRVKLNFHTPTQVLAGTTLSAVLMYTEMAYFVGSWAS